MDVTVKGIICLMKSSITGQPETLPEGFQAGRGIQLMFVQGLHSMGYIGALNCGISPESTAMVNVLDYYCLDVVTSERQLEHIQRICDAFEKNGIDHMPVKGTLLKHMYPSHELRKMGDADILIREAQYAAIVPIMKELGFDEAAESDHEHIWMNDHLKVELHKHLIPSYNKDLYSFFGVGWDLAKIQNGCRWAMTEEDAFVYNFIHFVKHFRESEANSRFIVDLWVHMRHCPQLDMDYIRQQMKKMKMEAFFDYIMILIQCWFEDRQWDERTEWITRELFNFDSQDRKEKSLLAKNIRDAQEAGSLQAAKNAGRMRRIFPDRAHMDWSYPQWKKTPLPLAWGLRWCDLLFNRRDVIKAHAQEQSNITEQAVENYRQDLEYVGLQFSDGVALPD